MPGLLIDSRYLFRLDWPLLPLGPFLLITSGLQMLALAYWRKLPPFHVWMSGAKSVIVGPPQHGWWCWVPGWRQSGPCLTHMHGASQEEQGGGAALQLLMWTRGVRWVTRCLKRLDNERWGGIWAGAIWPRSWELQKRGERSPPVRWRTKGTSSALPRGERRTF